MWQQSVKYDSNVCFGDIIKSSNYTALVLLNL